MIIPVVPSTSPLSISNGNGSGHNNSTGSGGAPEGATGASPFAQMLQQRQQSSSSSNGSNNNGNSSASSTGASSRSSGDSGNGARKTEASATTEHPAPHTAQTASSQENAEAVQQQPGKATAKGAGKGGAPVQRSALGRKAMTMSETQEAERPAKGAKKTDPAGTDAATGAGAPPTWPMPVPGAPSTLARLADAVNRKDQADAGDAAAKIDPTRASAGKAAPSSDALAGRLSAGKADAPVPVEGTQGLATEAKALPGNTPLPAGTAAATAPTPGTPAEAHTGRFDPADAGDRPALQPTSEAPSSLDKGLAGLSSQDARPARSDGPDLRTLERTLEAAANPAQFAATQRAVQTGGDERTGEALRGIDGKAPKVGALGDGPGLPAHAVAFQGPVPQFTPDTAPTTLTLHTPVQAPEFREALATQVSVLARDGVQEASLQLNPAELGPISVHISMDGAQARVDFAVDSAVTRQVIEAGLPELASALRDAGLTLSGGGVSQQSSQSQSAQQEAFARQGDSPQGRQGRGGNPEQGANPAPRHVQMNQGGLDLYA